MAVIDRDSPVVEKMASETCQAKPRTPNKLSPGTAIMRTPSLGRLLAAIAMTAVPTMLVAQVIDLTVNNVGVAIGDKPEMTGLRLNFRDRDLRRVNGVNATIWMPYQAATGTVNGIALGVPATGARSINGLAIGVFGVGVERDLVGIGMGVVGIGSGGSMSGIMIGGVGAGAGGDARGLLIGGIGAGVGGSFTGVGIGGVGVGTGGNATGILIGGIGVGAGGNVTGLAVGGVGVGAGGTLNGLSIGGIGVGAPELRGVAIGGFGAGAERARAIVLSGAYFKIAERGEFEGASVSAYNRVLGRQHGLTIGLLNYAKQLDGVQVGLINISDNDGVRRILPLLSIRE
jgi:hypothetical protein